MGKDTLSLPPPMGGQCDKCRHQTKEILTVHEAAKFLGLSSSTIYTYISKRKIPFVKRNGSVWLLRSRLMDWLLEGEKKPLVEMFK